MKKLLCLCAVLILSSCATQTYYINGGGGSLPDKEKLQPFFVSGIGQEQEMDAARICGGAHKVAKVESKLNFLDGFLGVITWGIYTPRTAKVYCTK